MIFVLNYSYLWTELFSFYNLMLPVRKVRLWWLKVEFVLGPWHAVTYQLWYSLFPFLKCQPFMLNILLKLMFYFMCNMLYNVCYCFVLYYWMYLLKSKDKVLHHEMSFCVFFPCGVIDFPFISIWKKVLFLSKIDTI